MRSFGLIFSFLLIYIIAALGFWWMSLHKQSNIISEKEIALIQTHSQFNPQSANYKAELAKIDKRTDSREKQYLGEGLTFLLIILAGAFIVFRSYRQNIKLGEMQNNFMLAVTHELKSPIAGVKLSLQTLQRHALDEQKKALVLGRSVAEVDRLNDLCTNILITSQIEGGQYQKVKEPVSISSVATELYEHLKIRVGERLKASIQPDAWIMGDKLLCEMALSNVIDNALKYSPTTKPVTLKLNTKAGMVHIYVQDQGPGIPEEERTQIFKKFYRMGAESTRAQKGTGLGLYLTSKILKQMKGNIRVGKNEGMGSCFHLQIPSLRKEVELPA